MKKLTPLDQIVLLSRGQPRASHCGWAMAGGRRKNLQTVIHSKTDWVTRTTCLGDLGEQGDMGVQYDQVDE